MSEWISVKERLPDKFEPVLTWNGYGMVEAEFCGRFGGGKTVVWDIKGARPCGCESCCTIDFAESEQPTYWMPLPEPPKST